MIYIPIYNCTVCNRKLTKKNQVEGRCWQHQMFWVVTNFSKGKGYWKLGRRPKLRVVEVDKAESKD